MPMAFPSRMKSRRQPGVLCCSAACMTRSPAFKKKDSSPLPLEKRRPNGVAEQNDIIAKLPRVFGLCATHNNPWSSSGKGFPNSKEDRHDVPTYTASGHMVPETLLLETRK